MSHAAELRLHVLRVRTRAAKPTFLAVEQQIHVLMLWIHAAEPTLRAAKLHVHILKLQIPDVGLRLREVDLGDEIVAHHCRIVHTQSRYPIACGLMVFLVPCEGPVCR